MKLSGEFVFHSAECRQGVKDPTKFYEEVSLLAGMDQLRCSVDKELFAKVIPGIKPFAPCICVFDYKPAYAQLRLVDIKVKN